jgi:tripartite-type tricarboxylate transporter receptor subunit TctC
MSLYRVAVLLITMLAATGVGAQDAWPSKPVRLISPFPAAGPLDVMARLYAQKLTENWAGRATAIVETQPGASGTIGTQAVSKAPPDGYTLLITVDIPIAMAPALFKTPYDPRRDLAPVAALGETISMVLAHPSTGIRTVEDLVARAKANPGKLAFASGGNASPGHMCMELIKMSAGIDMLHVPYKGAAPATAAILSGEVGLFCAGVTQGLPNIRAGKLFGLGTVGPKPSPLTPELKPLSLTWPEVSLSTWFVVMAPPATPPNVIAAAQAAFRRVYDDPTVQQKLAPLGIDPLWGTPAEVGQWIDRDLAKWTRVVKVANIKAD